MCEALGHGSLMPIRGEYSVLCRAVEVGVENVEVTSTLSRFREDYCLFEAYKFVHQSSHFLTEAKPFRVLEDGDEVGRVWPETHCSLQGPQEKKGLPRPRGNCVTPTPRNALQWAQTTRTEICHI